MSFRKNFATIELDSRSDKKRQIENMTNSVMQFNCNRKCISYWLKDFREGQIFKVIKGSKEWNEAETYLNLGKKAQMSTKSDLKMDKSLGVE